MEYKKQPTFWVLISFIIYSCIVGVTYPLAICIGLLSLVFGYELYLTCHYARKSENKEIEALANELKVEQLKSTIQDVKTRAGKNSLGAITGGKKLTF